VEYLWSDEAQRAFVNFYFRSGANEAFDAENPKLAQIELPFTIDYFGGWAKAYPDVIEHVFRNQVQKR
jgi:ABC-type sulfate transport system substrate-binding protein